MEQRKAASRRGAGPHRLHHADRKAPSPAFLAEALELYGGELLPGYYQDWIIPEQRRLADCYLTLGDRPKALEALDRLQRDYPTSGLIPKLDERRRRVQSDRLR